MSLANTYETRLCAFVDILGFRQLIEESVRRPSLTQNIRDILREVREATPVWERNPPVDIFARRFERTGVKPPEATLKAQEKVKENSKKERGTWFSDSLVLSSSLEGFAIRNLVISLILLSQNMAKSGYYVRGGVSLGLLCHETDMCFGPALISAYDLEKDAQYPRIVFDAEARRTLDRADASGVRKLASYLREDIDGIAFLHFLGQEALDLLPEFRDEHMSIIRQFLSRQLDSAFAKDARIKSKLFWLARYFNFSLNGTTLLDGITMFDLEKVVERLNLESPE
jgi:hypothetical protein